MATEDEHRRRRPRPRRRAEDVTADGDVAIAPMRPGDWDAVAAIYAEGIRTGDATFETAVPSREVFDERHLAEARLVARDGDEVVGWAALSRASIREVYRGVAECSVYVAEAARGRGVGEALLAALEKAADAAGIWTVEAVVFPENAASVAMLESCGFRIVGRRERLGRLEGRWRDVLLLERRGPID
jgi:L-amino acid N-acyltransferase YncA